MRRYEGEQENKLVKVICNKCGKVMKLENGYLKEGCFSANFSFGYFSQKDGTRHQFDLCEECYDGWVASMVVPVEAITETEIL